MTAQKPRLSEKNLIAEQSGLSVSFAGIILSIFLGVVIRGALNPNQIKKQVEEAASHIGPDIKINIEKAYLSLSNGFWPDFSVVINNVEIDSQIDCATSPVAQINEIRFPISIVDLLRRKPFIHKVEADSVVLSLRSEYKDCQKTKLPQTEANLGANVTKESSMSKENISAKTPDIKFLSVNKMRVNYLPLAFTSFELRNFEVNLKSESPKIFKLKSLLDLGGETLSGDYSSHALLRFDFDETRVPQINSQMSGHWREGHYDISVIANPPTSQIKVESELEHLPLSQIFPVLKKYKLMTSDFNGKQAWFSAKWKVDGQLGKLLQTPIEIEDLKFEGDLGEVSLKQGKIKSIYPVDFEPVTFALKDIQIDSVLTFLNRPHPSPAFGKLGFFNGSIEISRGIAKNEKTKIQGVHSGLEMIFSNKGSRQIQTIQNFSADFQLDSDQWDGVIDQVNIQGGNFQGKVKIKADKDWRELSIKAQATQFSLSPEIEKLMTGGGALSDLSAEIDFKLSQGELQSLKGFLAGDQVLVEGVEISKPLFKLNSQNQNFSIDFSSPAAVINSSSPMMEILNKVRPLDAPLALKNLGVNLKTQSLKNFSWNHLQIKAEGWALQSEGGWDEKDNLFGVFTINEKGKSTQWQLKGTRSQPLFLKN